MNLSNNPRLRLFVFSSLYFSQGIPTGFITITLAALWAKLGYSTSAVAALLVISYVPWALKLLYGPLVDLFASSPMGRRRPWILGSQLAMIGSVGLMLLVPDILNQPVILGALLFLYNSFCSLQDVATDALAIDLLEPDERGQANGMMWGGKILGIAFGGLVLSTLIAASSIQTVLWLQMGLLGLLMLLPLFIRERSDEKLIVGVSSIASSWRLKKENFSVRQLLNETVEAFESPSIRWVGTVALVAALPTRMLVVIGPVFVVKAAGWTSLGYSQFTGGPALLLGALGALSGGYLADKFGRRETLVLGQAGILLLLVTFAFSGTVWTNATVVALFIGTGVMLDVTMKTTLATLFMDVTQPDLAATQFTIFMTLGNLCNVLGGLLIIPLDFTLGFFGLFLTAALFSASILVFLCCKPLRHAINQANAPV